MNLLSLILIFLGLIVGASVCYVAWELSSGRWGPEDNPEYKKEPGESKEPKDSPGS
jgi:hypothetical protein